MEYKNKKICQRIPINLTMTPGVLSFIDEHRGDASRRLYLERLVMEKMNIKEMNKNQ
jgi:hypothetical protein